MFKAICRALGMHPKGQPATFQQAVPVFLASQLDRLKAEGQLIQMTPVTVAYVATLAGLIQKGSHPLQEIYNLMRGVFDPDQFEAINNAFQMVGGAQGEFGDMVRALVPRASDDICDMTGGNGYLYRYCVWQNRITQKLMAADGQDYDPRDSEHANDHDFVNGPYSTN